MFSCSITIRLFLHPVVKQLGRKIKRAALRRTVRENPPAAAFISDSTFDH
jgi:hypothetical protein